MHDLKNDIEKYLAGKLTPAEMHALEKRALDDPFLADAIEGASTLDAPDFAADVSSLKAALQQRAQKKTAVVPLWQWAVRIAAGIIIVALSGYVMYYLMSPNDKPIELALNKPEDPQHSIPPPATDTKKEPSAPEFKNRIKTDKPVQQEATPASPETVTTAPTSAYAASHDVLAAEEPPLDPVANNPKEDQPARAEMMPAKAEAEEAASAYAVDKKKGNFNSFRQPTGRGI